MGLVGRLDVSDINETEMISKVMIVGMATTMGGRKSVLNWKTFFQFSVRKRLYGKILQVNPEISNTLLFKNRTDKCGQRIEDHKAENELKRRKVQKWGLR